MRVLQSIWSLSSDNGGPTRSTIGLSKALGRAGVKVTLVSHVPKTIQSVERVSLNSSGVSFFEGRGDGFLVALSDSRSLIRVVRPDIVHLQGLWKMSTHAMNVAATEARVPIVVSPRGMLDPWALSVKKWKKKLGMFLYQHSDLRRVVAFHATAPEEVTHIKAVGYGQPCIVSPNGVDLPCECSVKRDGNGLRTGLFLSRLHPGKGLMALAEAWARIRPKGWRMRVIGPDSYGHKCEVIAKLETLGIIDDWFFEAPLDDIKKWSAYVSSDLLIHPSVSENFGITIAEGLAAGLPVIATKGTPWSELESNKCGWWVDVGVEPLAKALHEAISLDDGTRHEMGTRGRKLIESKYTWNVVVKPLIKGYEEILGQKPVYDSELMR